MVEDVSIRLLRAIHKNTGGIPGKPVNPQIFLSGSGLTKKEFDTLLTSLISKSLIKRIADNVPDIVITQEGLGLIGATIPEGIQQKTIEFLKVLSAESGGNAINLDYYVLKLGEHVGLDLGGTVRLIESLHKNGYIRLTGAGNNSSIAISQLGKKLIESDSAVKYPAVRNPRDMPYRIFISHITENESIAQKLKDFLISIFGDKIAVFVAGDPDSISFSHDWFERIKKGIRECDLMMLLCTPESVKRPWINFEAGAAVILEKQIGPVCFAGLTAGGLPAPLTYIRSQAMDCSNDDKFRKHFEILLKEIADQIGIKGLDYDILKSDFYQELKVMHPIKIISSPNSKRIVYRIEDDYKV